MSWPVFAIFLVIRSRNDERVPKQSKIVLHISTKIGSVPTICAQNIQISTVTVFKNYNTRSKIEKGPI